MVAIHVDASYIFMEPMKKRTSGHMVETYQRIHRRMTAAGLGVKKHYLDNEASEEYKTAIRENECEVERVAPDNHRCNIAERAIQTAKDHLVSVLAGADVSFPMHLWCRLLVHAELQLNLQRMSNMAPKVCAYVQHNFMKRLFAPLGCPVQIHSKPGNR